MAKCLRCNADASWLQGRIPIMSRDDEVALLRALVAEARSLFGDHEFNWLGMSREWQDRMSTWLARTAPKEPEHG